MAKLVGDAAGKVRRIFKKSAYIYTKNGQAYLSSWPRKSSGPVTQKLQDARDLMRERSLAIKAMPFRITDYSTRYSRGTMLMPRDWLFMGLAGRYIRVWMPEERLDPDQWLLGSEGHPPQPRLPTYFNPEDSVGRLRPIYSMATLDDLSDLFDIYGDAVGTLFYRTVYGWRGLAPGIAGQVLTVQPDQSLAWRGAGGGGGGGYAKTILQITTPPASPVATPYTLIWQAAALDDLGLWSSAQPQRITLPANTLFYRVSLSFTLSSGLRTEDLIASLRYDPSGNSIDPQYQLRAEKTSQHFTNSFMNIAGAFLPPPEEPQLFLRLNATPQSTVTFTGPIFATIEIITGS